MKHKRLSGGSKAHNDPRSDCRSYGGKNRTGMEEKVTEGETMSAMAKLRREREDDTESCTPNVAARL